DVHDIRVARIGHNPCYGLGVPQSHVCEGFARIGRLIDAVAHRGTLPVVGLACPDPDDIGIGLTDINIPDRRRRISLEYRLPGGSIVDGLPDAAGSQSEIYNVGVAFHGGDVVDAAAHAGRADGPEPKSLQYRVVRRIDSRALRRPLRRTLCQS